MNTYIIYNEEDAINSEKLDIQFNKLVGVHKMIHHDIQDTPSIIFKVFHPDIHGNPYW